MGGGGPVGQLRVNVVEARRLNSRSFSGKCNASAAVRFDSESHRTDVIKNSINPKWNAFFTFDVYGNVPDQNLRISVWEKPPLFSHVKLGSLSFPMTRFQEKLTWQDWFNLSCEKNPSRTAGQVQLGLQLSPCEGVTPAEFATFVKNLALGNNWVVLDPEIDGYQVTDSIVDLPAPSPAPVRALPGPPDDIIMLDDDDVEMKREGEQEHWQPPSGPSGATLGEAICIPDDCDEGVRQFLLAEQQEQEKQLQDFLARQYCCCLCQVVSKPHEVIDLDCGHLLCQGCVRSHVTRALAIPTCVEISCPSFGCPSSLPQWALRRVMEEKDLDEFLMRSFVVAFESNEQMFRCPNANCNSVIERAQPCVGARRDSQMNISEQSELSAEAQEHLDRFRFRCRDCSTEFCSDCFRMPYHTGFTCEQYTTYLASRRCRFCESALGQASAAAQCDPLADVCNDAECQAKKRDACTKTHEACGHPCGGIRGETQCLPCLNEDCATSGQTGSDYCNVCFVEGLESAPSIKLGCSHVLHYQCALAKIRQKWPSPRITFGFRNCPVCKERMKHPALEAELQPIDQMERDMAKNAVQRLSFEGLENHEDMKKPSGRFYRDPEAFAMHRFAYYPCFKCKKPYFGGQARCDAGDGDREFSPEELVCGACSGADDGACAVHGKEFMEHKCQYCCKVASWFCWGKTHFCDDCHTRQQKGDYVSKYEVSKLPKCPGKSACPLGIEHPPNGTPFCMGCAFCRQSL